MVQHQVLKHTKIKPTETVEQHQVVEVQACQDQVLMHHLKVDQPQGEQVQQVQAKVNHLQTASEVGPPNHKNRHIRPVFISSK